MVPWFVRWAFEPEGKDLAGLTDGLELMAEAFGGSAPSDQTEPDVVRYRIHRRAGRRLAQTAPGLIVGRWSRGTVHLLLSDDHLQIEGTLLLNCMASGDNRRALRVAAGKELYLSFRDSSGEPLMVAQIGPYHIAPTQGVNAGHELSPTAHLWNLRTYGDSWPDNGLREAALAFLRSIPHVHTPSRMPSAQELALRRMSPWLRAAADRERAHTVRAPAFA
jgi:hypothetical protein